MDRVLQKREQLGFMETNTAELAAFIAYAQAFPTSFLALVDTYDTLQSGVPNYILVAAVLVEMGFKVRLFLWFTQALMREIVWNSL